MEGPQALPLTLNLSLRPITDPTSCHTHFPVKLQPMAKEEAGYFLISISLTDTDYDFSETFRNSKNKGLEMKNRKQNLQSS